MTRTASADVTDPSDPATSFEFEVISSSQTENTLTVQWNQEEADGVMVMAALIDDTDMPVTISASNPDTFTVELDRLKTGIYDQVRFTLLNGTKQEYVEQDLRVIKGGDLNLKFDELRRNASAVDHDNVAPLRRIRKSRQNQAVVIHQGRLHGLAVHPYDPKEKGKNQYHDN